jgi:1-deoxy-D-xylulose-5-phosphate reductoisomerase
MSDVIESTLQKVTFLSQPAYDDYVASDEEARSIAMEFVANL